MRLILTLLFSGLMAFGQDNVAAKEDALGRQLSARFTASNPPLADAEVQGYLDQLVHKISNFRVTLIANDPCAALHEATSFPGGSLFVPAALILAAHSESELAGMLAQSIALLSVEAPKESNGGLIFVNLGCAEHQVMRLMDGKSDKEAVQQRVMKADALAMQTLSRAGFNPEGLLSYVQRVQKLSFSVYTALPDRDLRVNQMRLVLQTMPASKNSENDSEFSAAQERLRTLTQIQPAAAKLPTLWRDGEQR